MHVLQETPQAGVSVCHAAKAAGLNSQRPLLQSRLSQPNKLNPQRINMPDRAYTAFNSRYTHDALSSIGGALRSVNFGNPTPPLTPTSFENPNPFGATTPSTKSPHSTQMNSLALKSIFRDLKNRDLVAEEDVSTLWSDILSTVTTLNSPSPHILEEQPAASRHHEISPYMTYAVRTRADWLPHHNTVNLILYNHHEATTRDPSSYSTWQPAVAKMTAWLRERQQSNHDYLSQPTFGLITAGKKWLLLMLYSGSRRAYGEPDTDGNVKVRDLADKEDQGLLARLLQHVASASPLQESVGFEMSVTWAPLEVGKDESAAQLNSGRRDSRSEMKKPAVGAMQIRKMAAAS